MEWAPVTGALLPSCLQRQGRTPGLHCHSLWWQASVTKIAEKRVSQEYISYKALDQGHLSYVSRTFETEDDSSKYASQSLSCQVNVVSPSKFPRGAGYTEGDVLSSFQKISSGGFPLHSSHLGSFYIFDTPDDEIHYIVLLNHSYLGTFVCTCDEGEFGQIKWESKPFEMVKFFPLGFLFYVLWVVFFFPPSLSGFK